MVDTSGTPKAFLVRFEELNNKISDELYKQYAGLPFSEEKMKDVSRMLEVLCQDALKRFKVTDFDRKVLFSIIAGANTGEYTQLGNDIYKKRNEEVVVQVDKEIVNLNNVRKFNADNKKDSSLRKKVFDALMRKSSVITPLVQKRFDLSRKIYSPYKMDPIDIYLETENIEFRRLIQFLNNLGNGSRDTFYELANKASQNILGKQTMEYYDDYYVFRHTLFSSLDPIFKRLNAISKMNNVYTNLGFQLRKINIDLETRKGKYSSPIMFSVHVPNDVRVLSQTVSPFSDFTSYCHEMGHALHYSSIDINRPYQDKYEIPYGISEVFSIFFERLATNPLFLKQELGLDDAMIANIESKKKFMDLYFIAFYVANSMFKIDYWKEKLSMHDANERFSDMTERFMKIRYPGEYWQTHHVLSQYDVYAPSYLIASVRAYELEQYVEKKFGKDWWNNPEMGEWIREELMKPGASVDMSIFSTLDEKAYLKSILS